MNKKERQQIFDKYNGRCAYCGCDLQKGWHVDHAEPIRRGLKYKKDANGKYLYDENGEHFKEYYETHPDRNVVQNYMPACVSCNINKRSDTIEQFRKNIQGYLNSLNLRMVQYKMVKKYGLVQETNKPVIFHFETVESSCS